MKQTNLSLDELNKRAGEVFELQEGDYIYDVEVNDGKIDIDSVTVNMEEVDEKGRIVNFDYKPDMTERLEALDYLLGLRNDFND